MSSKLYMPHNFYFKHILEIKIVYGPGPQTIQNCLRTWYTLESGFWGGKREFQVDVVFVVGGVDSYLGC